MSFLAGFLLGVFGLLGYCVWRMLRSDGWDRSNMLNALRLLSHVVAHPEDLLFVWFVDSRGQATRKPFWYVGRDEFEFVVNTRPKPREQAYGR